MRVLLLSVSLGIMGSAGVATPMENMVRLLIWHPHEAHITEKMVLISNLLVLISLSLSLSLSLCVCVCVCVFSGGHLRFNLHKQGGLN